MFRIVTGIRMSLTRKAAGRNQVDQSTWRRSRDATNDDSPGRLRGARAHAAPVAATPQPEPRGGHPRQSPGQQPDRNGCHPPRKAGASERRTATTGRGVELLDLAGGQRAVVQMHLVDRAVEVVDLVAAVLASADHRVAGGGGLGRARARGAGRRAVHVQSQLALDGVADADQVVPPAGRRLDRGQRPHPGGTVKARRYHIRSSWRWIPDRALSIGYGTSTRSPRLLPAGTAAPSAAFANSQTPSRFCQRDRVSCGRGYSGRALPGPTSSVQLVMFFTRESPFGAEECARVSPSANTAQQGCSDYVKVSSPSMYKKARFSSTRRSRCRPVTP